MSHLPKLSHQVHGARPSLVDVDDIIPMGKRVDESFPPSEIGNLEFFQIIRDFENFGWAWQEKILKICVKNFHF